MPGGAEAVLTPWVRATNPASFMGWMAALVKPGTSLYSTGVVSVLSRHAFFACRTNTIPKGYPQFQIDQL